MYIPPAFAITDPAKLADVISSNNFGMLISRDGDSFFASHLPFLHFPNEGKNGLLRSHLAKANRHWHLFKDNEEIFVIFNGPHAYISPTWYAAEFAVPTWNYVTVHVHGLPRITNSESEINAILDETVAKHESGLPTPWTPNLPSETKGKLQQAIVGFEIEITRIEGKFKLGQNRSKEDRDKMLSILESSSDPDSLRLAAYMRREFQD